MHNGLARRRSPATEFPAETVALCQRDGRTTGQVAKNTDPGKTAAQARADRAGPDGGARDDDRLACADRHELAQLRRENGRLREDVEILKRATAIFAAIR